MNKLQKLILRRKINISSMVLWSDDKLWDLTDELFSQILHCNDDTELAYLREQNHQLKVAKAIKHSIKDLYQGEST